MTTQHRPRTSRRLAGVGLALAALAGTATAVAPAATAHDGAHETTTYGSSVNRLSPSSLSRLMQLKGTLAAYRTPEAAVAAGYLPSPVCVSSPDGTMGYHYVNPTLLGSIDPARPPMLVYVPGADGLTLGAAEWFAVDGDQDPSTDGDRPSLLGIPFDGPMPGHEPGMPVHYDLHVWLFAHNPAGLTAPFNPAISCPA